jgi:hypothetical protein
MRMTKFLFTIDSEGGARYFSSELGGAAGYHSPAIDVLYCGGDTPLLDSPGAGFTGDEGGLDVEDLD